MKNTQTRKRRRFTCYRPIIGLAAILTLDIPACSKKLAVPTAIISSIDVEASSPANLPVGSTQQFQAFGTTSTKISRHPWDITSEVI
jgi:hypothetical protein